MTTATISTESTPTAVKPKRFYKTGEFVWIRALKKKGKVKSLDIKNLEVTVTYFEGKDNLKEVTLKFMEIDKLRDREGDVVPQRVTNKTDNKNSTPRKRDVLKFAKVTDDAVIPSKRDEDSGYDIYARQTLGDIVIAPNQVVLVPTGIASAFSPKLRAVIKERSSTGVKGLAVRAGTIDSGFRNEWKVVLNNNSNRTIVITNKVLTVVEESTMVYYPITKAIAQINMQIVPTVDVEEISYAELADIPSVRGLGGFGSSGK